MRGLTINRPTVFVALAVLLTVGVAWNGGCVRHETIIVPAGEPIQLAESVEAYIYVDICGEAVESAYRVTIPAGWWCLPDPGPEPPE